jgi:hypothetical protein
MTYRNTSEEWGDAVTGLTIEDYRQQAAMFAASSGEPAAEITADDEHVYADGEPVAEVES